MTAAKWAVSGDAGWGILNWVGGGMSASARYSKQSGARKEKRRISDAPSKLLDAFPAVQTASSNARLLSSPVSIPFVMHHPLVSGCRAGKLRLPIQQSTHFSKTFGRFKAFF
ncbi:hypothetical protein [Herbaspirillum sp. alder98]|uniref:hypothetical protein n=1 Tax=Herbaspirillum sp. alder98 TaxID=2913096 RepID=UPI001CD8F9C8|nr:hypothetical protein [Herbaspirillum sp. alder98]MCA1325151.1 hypothetical protein [Herbaspirillum sp. alder98]